MEVEICKPSFIDGVLPSFVNGLNIIGTFERAVFIELEGCLLAGWRSGCPDGCGWATSGVFMNDDNSCEGWELPSGTTTIEGRVGLHRSTGVVSGEAERDLMMYSFVLFLC